MLKRFALLGLSLAITIGICELCLRFVYDPLGWLSKPNWEEELYARTYAVRQSDWSDVSANPDLKYLWGGSRLKIPLPFKTYRLYVDQLYQSSSNTVLGFVHRPNARVHFTPGQGFYYEMNVSINSIGLRDQEIIQPKPKNTFRIFFCGDSVTFGPGVEGSDTFVERLEKALNVQAQPGWHFDVINFGVGGYNTQQELQLLKTLDAFQYKPDLVLLGVAMNDASQTNSMMSWQRDLTRIGGAVTPDQPQATLTDEATAKEIGRLVGARLHTARIAIYGLQVIRKTLDRHREQKKGGISWRESLRADSVGKFTPEAERFVKTNLTDFVSYIRSNNVPMGFVVFPFEFALDPNHPRYAQNKREYEEWTRLLKEAHEPTFDILGAFNNRRSEFIPGSLSSGLYVDWDGIHFNKRGHAMVADALVPLISDRWPLPLRKTK